MSALWLCFGRATGFLVLEMPYRTLLAWYLNLIEFVSYSYVLFNEKTLMKLNKVALLSVVCAVLTSGCASYRTSSNIATEASAVQSTNSTVLISEGSLSDRKYKEIAAIEVSVKKLTVFHKDPTKEQANEALTEKARVIGADAVINTTYKSGVGLTTWGYIDAKGTGVKLAD
ncbi:hypothetical protein [Comamonas sp.]|uniref:hypothetical protein n=1 Tax=Comamonas sp. TaxID=34028 RepID=UPI002896C1D7|nr:hypothetical protein [Comamonas sp.]